MKEIALIGEGAWGTAIATLLAKNGIRVRLWCYHKEVAQEIKEKRTNSKYMPGIILSDLIIPYTDLKDAVENVEYIFEAIPVAHLRSVLEKSIAWVKPSQTWVVLSKGIENNTLMLPTQIIDDVFGSVEQKAVLVGPSFARDVATEQITAVTLAATNCSVGTSLQLMIANHYFRPYLSLDIIGVQMGAAIKNVIAIAIGILDGAGYSDNVKSFVLTRGLYEMAMVTQFAGGKPETIYGLSGVGDLVLTAMGTQGKNREVGKLLGQGKSLDAILKETGYIPEGINTATAIWQMIEKNHLDLPVCKGVYEILGNKKTIEDLLAELMNRPLEEDCRIK